MKAAQLSHPRRMFSRPTLAMATFVLVMPSCWSEDLPRIINGQEKLISETVGAYRKFGGWLFPCSFVSFTDGKEGENLQIQNVEINLPANEITFQIPVAAAAAPGSRAPVNPASPGSIPATKP